MAKVTEPGDIVLTQEEFALLYEYLDREHSLVFDPNTVGQTTKIGKKLWDRIQEVAAENDFVPTHTPIHGPIHMVDPSE